MPNTPNNVSAQTIPTSETNAFMNLNVGQIGILIIQGFAILVAFSTLLGRIYFQEYAKSLNIPESEFRLNALDYSVFSPDVAISGFGVAIFSIVLVTAFRWKIEPKLRRLIFVIGIILLAVCLYTVLRDFLKDEIPEPGSGAFGIWWILVLAGWILGTALIISALNSWLADNPVVDRRPRCAKKSKGRKNAKLSQDGGRIIAQVSLFALGAVTITLLLIAALLQSTVVGRMNAVITLRDAPLVQVEVISSSTSAFLKEDKGSVDGELLPRTFKLVHLGENFAYLRKPEHSCIRPADAGVAPGQPFQYAVPAADIVSITYLLQ